MEDETLFFQTQKEWEAWLEAHHKQKEAIRMLMYKKHTHKPCISYEEALDVALCYGWIDGKLNRIDDASHTIRFSPRRKNSIWSKKNRTTVLKLLEEEKVKPLGLEKIKEAKANGKWDEALICDDTLPELLSIALDANPKAKAFYHSLPMSAKKQYNWWIFDAKRDETKEKRVEQSIYKLSKSQRLWEKG